MQKPDFFRYRKLLLMRTDRIGDLLVTTPCIRALRQALPAARIDLVASPLNAAAVQGNPHLDHVYVFDLHKPLSWPGFILRLRRVGYDVILAFNSNSRNGTLLLSLLGTPERIAFSGLPSRKGKTLEQYAHYYTWMCEGSGKAHVMEDMLAKMNDLGVPAVLPHIDFIVPDSLSADLEHRFPAMPDRLRLAIFVGNIKKVQNRWPIEKFRELTQRLLAADDLSWMDVVLLAGPPDKPLLDAFSDFHHPRFNTFVGVTLQETGAFLKTCGGLVAGSSSPAHIAAALELPVLSVVTEYNATVWNPLGPLDRCVTPPPELGKDLRDMRGITVDAVESALRAFLASVRKSLA